MIDDAVMPISSLIGDDVIRISPNASVRQLAALLIDNAVGLAVVGLADEVTGVVSERDIVRAVATGLDPESEVLEITKTHLSWCDSSASASAAAEKMMEHYVRHILVADRGRLVGVLSARDLLGYFVALADDPADVA